jgi:hypothetical protein
MPEKVDKEKAIRALVKNAVETFAGTFKGRHEAEVDDPDGTINMKIHNVFIAILGEELQYYTALVRSFDSSLGNMLEKLAVNIASLSFEVKKSVEGNMTAGQTQKIAELLETYKRREKKPEVKDYSFLNDELKAEKIFKRHDSDYYLYNKKQNTHYLIELKIGGDLDNKKARSEKEAILEQYAILSNTIKGGRKIKIFFATAYNRFGEGNAWKQERVRQFFADDELLIGEKFWNFVCDSGDGYQIVLDEYKKNAKIIKEALESIKKTYLD